MVCPRGLEERKSSGEAFSNDRREFVNDQTSVAKFENVTNGVTAES